jgi:hypothetical protein
MAANTCFIVLASWAEINQQTLAQFQEGETFDRRATALPRLLGTDVQDKERVLKLVRHRHSPFVVGGKMAVQALQYPSSRHARLLPSCILLGKLLALAIF